ncbi:MAG: DsbA family protein [Acidimicrobiales bacterium]
MSGCSTPIEVFADITCPFTHVGLRRLVQRRGALSRTDVRFWVRAWPLELVNGSPLESGAVGHKVDELRAQVAPDLFSAFDLNRFPVTSIPALVLAAHAYDLGLEVGEEVSLRLRDALFERGLDVSRPEVLDEVARRAGVAPADAGDCDRVVADWHEGRRRGVIGSPHFFVAGRGWFCPSLEVSHDEHGELRVTDDEESFERFATTCFGT